MRNTFTYLLTIMLSILSHYSLAQCNHYTNAVASTPNPTSSVWNSASTSLTYNPVDNVYYSVRGNYIITHSSTGAQLNSFYTTSTINGIWWNSNTNQLEGNGYGTLGIVAFTLNTNHYPTSFSVVFSGSNHQPYYQSVGVYDAASDQIWYPYGSQIYKYSRSTGLYVTSLNLTGSPVTTTYFADYQIALTPCSSKGIIMYDWGNERAMYFNKSTGVYQGYTQMPTSLPSISNHGYAYTNGKFFVRNGYNWNSYNILYNSITTSAITSNFCDSSSVSVGFSTTSTTFNSGNVFTAQLSNASGSFSSPTTIGTLTGTTAANISCIIPNNTPAGTGYRIRVVSSNPVAIGSDNGSDIIVNIPTLNIPAASTHCSADTLHLTPVQGGFNYSWSTGATTPTLPVTSAGTYSVTVSNGVCSDSATTVVTTVTSPTISMADTVVSCSSSTTITATAATSYAWSTGATTQALTVDEDDDYSVTITDANGCTASHTTSAFLIQPNLNVGDTTICAGETLDVYTNSSCGIGNIALNTTNAYSTSYSSYGDDRGGIAVTQDYVYVTNDYNTLRYNTGLTNTPTLYSVHDGLFSNMANGDLYTLWNSNYTNFSSSNTRTNGINQIRPLNDDLTSAGSPITLSQTINAQYSSILFTGHNMLFIFAQYNDHVYQIDIPSGTVTDHGYHALSPYISENWAANGTVECDGNGHFNLIFRQSNWPQSIVKYNTNTNTYTTVVNGSTTTLGDMFTFAVSPWNNRWYFITGEGYSFANSFNYDQIVYADASFTGSSSQTNTASSVLWSTGDTASNISIAPSTTTTYWQSNTVGSTTCADTFVVTVNANPSITMADTVDACNIDSVQVGPTSTHTSYAWSSGATTQTPYFKTPGIKHITVTNSNGCTNADSVYFNLLDSRIDQIDTTLCSADSLDLTAGSLCGNKIQSLTTSGFQNIGLYGDDRGGIAATTDYVYITTDNYTVRTNHSFTTTTNLTLTDGIFSDLSTGKLYRLQSSTSRYINTNYIIQIQELDANLNFVGTPINLSQTISANSTFTFLAAGSGFILLYNSSNVYHIEIETGQVTDLGTYNLNGAFAYNEAWAIYGIAECNGNGYSIVGRGNNYNSTNLYNSIIRINLWDGSHEIVESRTQGFADVGNITYSPWNNKWYLSNEGGGSGLGSFGENLLGASATGTMGFNSVNQSLTWSTGDTNNLITISPDTTTQFTATATYGSFTCIDTLDVTVIQSPTVSDSTAALTCYLDTTGFVNLTVSGGTTPYSYNWSNGDTIEDVSGLSPGMYYYSVTGANNCVVMDSILVDSPDEITLTSSVISSATCFNVANGSAITQASGGSAPYSYLWPSGGTDSTNAFVQGGDNIITVTDGNGCVATDTVFMSSPSEITSPGPITTSTAFFCPGGTGSIVAGNPGQPNTLATYFNTTAAQSPSPNYNSNMGFTFTGIPTNITGNVTLTVYFRGNFDSWSERVYVYDENNSSLGNSYNINPIGCNLGVYTLTLTASQMTNWLADGNVTFNIQANQIALTGCPTTVYVSLSYNYISDVVTYWFTSPTTDTTQAIGSGATLNISPQGNTTYYSANFSSGCNSDFDSINITTLPKPSTAYVQTPTSICPGQTATVTGYGATSYTWPSDSTISGSGSSATVTPVSSNSYIVTISNALGCTYDDTMTVNLLPAPQGNVLATTPVTCSGNTDGTAAVFAVNGTSPYTYSWPGGLSGALQLALSDGTYAVTITDANNCSDTLDVTVNGPGSVHFNATVSQISCNGAADGAITLNPTGGSGTLTYAWSNGGTTSSISNLVPNSYTVTISDGSSCTYDTTIVITQPSALFASIASTSPESCPGLSNGAITTAVTGGTTPYTFSWSNGGTTSALTNVPGNTYFVTVTDANGCTSITSGTVLTNPSTLAASITSTIQNLCNGDSLGSATAGATGGTAPYTYAWSDGQSGATATQLPATNFTVTVTDVNGCQANTNVSITEPTAITSSASILTQITCNGANNGSASVNVSGGTPTYTYAWPNGNNGAAVSNLSPGTHIITITDANSCIDTASVVVTEPTAITINPVVTDVTCFGLSDGNITTAALGGTGSLTYSWNGGQTTSGISNLVANTYAVTVTDANSCTADTSLTVAQPVTLAASINTFSNIACKNDSTGSARVDVTGGTTPFTYAWNNGVTLDSISNAPIGGYTVTVTDVNGCSDTANVTLTEPATLLALNVIQHVNILCNGNNSGLLEVTSAGGGTNHVFNWSNGVNTGLNANLIAGTYTVSLSDDFGCIKDTTLFVTQPAPLQVSANSITNLTCKNAANGAITTQTSGGVTPYSYSWSNGSVTADLNGLDSNMYTLTVTDANACTDTVSVHITEPDSLFANITNFQNVACNGNATGFAKVEGNGGTMPYTYAWSTGSTADSIFNQTAGFYTVTITDANGCVDSTLANLTQPSSLVLSATNIVNNLCYADSLGSGDVTVQGGAAPYQYDWSNGATGASQNSLPAGNFIVTVTDNNNCMDTALVTITEPTQVITGADSISMVSCYGVLDGEIMISSTGGVGNYSYLWSNNATNDTITGLGAGTYYLTITDGNACINTDSFTVTQPLMLTVSDTFGDVLCNGDSTGFITTTVTGGTLPYSYAWSNAATSASLANIPNNTYSLTVTDANMCTDTLTRVIGQPNALAVSIGSYVDINCAGDSTGQAVASVTGGALPYTYAWTDGQTSMTAAQLYAGIHQVIVTDSNGCSDSADVTLNEISNIQLTSTSVIDPTCNGDSTGAITIASTGGIGNMAYNWNNGATGNSLSMIPSGTYVVTATDSLACIDTMSVVVVQPMAITPSITETLPTCNNDSNGVLSVTFTGGTGNISWVWNTGDTTNTISGLSADTFMITATDGNNCLAEFTHVLANPAILVNAGFNVTQPACYYNTNGTAVAQVSGGITPYSYAWSDNQTNAQAIGLGIGMYQVTITDSNGCTLIDSVQVDPAQPQVNLNIPADTNYCGDTLVLNVPNVFVNYVWSNGSNSASSAPVTTTQTLTFTGLDSGNCIYNDTININMYPAMQLDLGMHIDSVCEGNTQTLDAGNFSTYQWNTGASTQTISVDSTGGYSVTVTNVHSCIAEDSIHVNFWANPVVDLGPDTVICDADWTGELVLDAGAGNFSYKWNSGRTNQTDTVTTQGVYHVTVTNAIGCSDRDTIVVSFDPCLSVEEVGNNINVKVYPNPTRGLLTVEANGNIDDEIELEVLSTNGQMVARKTIIANGQTTHQTTFDLSHVAKGIYFVKISSGDNQRMERIMIF